MKTTKAVCVWIIGESKSEIKMTVILATISVILAALSTFAGMRQVTAFLLFAAAMYLLIPVAIFVCSSVVIGLCMILDLLLFIKGSIDRHGFVTVLLKVMAAIFLICSSYVLIKAFQPGTGLYVVFRTEQPSPFFGDRGLHGDFTILTDQEAVTLIGFCV